MTADPEASLPDEKGSPPALTSGTDGVTFSAAGGRIRFGPSRSSISVVLPSGAVVITTAPDANAGDLSDQGVAVERAIQDSGDGRGEIRGRVVNRGPETVAVERFTLLHTDRLAVGDDPRRWRTYRNGYQSWSGTTTIGPAERDRDLLTRLGRAGATDARHPAPSAQGHIRSDSLSAVVEPVSGDALALGFTDLAEAFAFIELDAPDGVVRSLSAWVDLDGTALEPGEATPWFTLHLATATGDSSAGLTALRTVAKAIGAAMGARGTDRNHPGGWCSWYFYFTNVTEGDVLDNLAVLADDGRDGPDFGCEYVMVDDGHQTAIGDWLSTNDKFPSGMAAVARRITDEGFDAGIWWAPFIASARSQVAREHPDWLVRNQRGRPILGLVNPGWGVTTPMWVLDTTHPEVLEHLHHVAGTIGDEWGYAIQKLDFLYAAALPGIRHDPAATRAHSLRRGLDAIREGAGDDAFLLGCGCPLGPAVGVVDAMRIGADVTPSWTSLIGRTVGRNRHGLSTLHALVNTLSRSVLDGAWFLNDPDCLMVRDTDTSLTIDEVRLMGTVFGMTDGMLVLSDRLDRLPSDRRAMVAQTRALAGGRPEVVDLFQRGLPELLVSRHPDDRVDVGLLNLGDAARHGTVDLAPLGLADRLAPGAEVVEFWTGSPVTVRGSVVDVSPLPRHSARVLRVAAP